MAYALAFERTVEPMHQLALYGLQVESSPLAVDKQFIVGYSRKVVLYRESQYASAAHIGSLLKSGCDARSYRICHYNHVADSACLDLYAIVAELSAKKSHLALLGYGGYACATL